MGKGVLRLESKEGSDDPTADQSRIYYNKYRSTLLSLSLSLYPLFY